MRLLSCLSWRRPFLSPVQSETLALTQRFSVYGPFSGTQGGQATYCDTTTTHRSGVDGMCCPTDLITSANTSVKFYGSSNITSIRTYRVGPNDNNAPLCLNPPPSAYSWVNEGVKVELYAYTNGQGYVGTVYYGHLKERIANGVYNYPNGSLLGKIGDSNCNCDCYKGFHTHMETSSGGVRVSRACKAAVGNSSTIYYFDRDRIPI
jgi:hypothetical protein